MESPSARYEAHSHESNLCTSSIDATIWPLPSSLQIEAIRELQNNEDAIILSWLSLLRALKPGFQHASRSEGFTKQQFDALIMLLDLPNSLVLDWLEKSRVACEPLSSSAIYDFSLISTSGQSEAYRTCWSDDFDSIQRGPSSPHIKSQQGSLNPTRNTSVDSQGAFCLQSSQLSPNTSKTSWSRVNSASDLPRNLSNLSTASMSSSSGAHNHWCTCCENPKAMTTCEGWKRHMKEHETIYICMPNGAIDIERKCVLCGIVSPDQNHLNSHNISSCMERHRRYTRKCNLVKHLEMHGAVSSTKLADSWRVTLEKRYFSCGFCVALFFTRSEQLAHIDNHFRNYEDISDWDFDKVISGLLLQPDVVSSWDSVSGNHDKSAFSWDRSLNKDLQLRLELSDEPADALALAAFNDSTYDDGHSDPGLTMLSLDELMRDDSLLSQHQLFDLTQ